MVEGGCTFGYKSNGTYTDGWFGGTCGTGIPHYLLCPGCRQKYMPAGHRPSATSIGLAASDTIMSHVKMISLAPDLMGTSHSEFSKF